jgi:hypothetical protein
MQIENSYRFICNVIKTHSADVYKPPCTELISLATA